METLSIGETARRAGLAVETLRYYERRGLLAPHSRTASGYRRYGMEALRRLRFIRRAQALGFSLDEIADLLALSADPAASAAGVRRLTRARIADVEARIRDLERVRDALAALERHCPGAHGSTRDCPILAALGDGVDDGDAPVEPAARTARRAPARSAR